MDSTTRTKTEDLPTQRTGRRKIAESPLVYAGLLGALGIGRQRIAGCRGLFLIRWVLLRTRLFWLQFHAFVRSDEDRELHDHPFAFVSLILRNGYVEVRLRPEVRALPEAVRKRLDLDDPRFQERKRVRPGALIFRPADWAHRIELLAPDRPSWSLVLRTGKLRDWGFFAARGWVRSADWFGAKILRRRRRVKFIDELALDPALRRLRELIVVDLFCGAGGASQGLLLVLGRLGLSPEALAARGWRLRLINVNHWKVAIETVRRNIAFAELYNAKIDDVDPRFVLRGARPHLLIASAECIMHSSARGNKPIKDQSRTTAAWILEWLKTDPHALFVENVPEWCFPANTLVLTKNGYKAICEIQIGDEVLTHEKRWKKVLRTFERQTESSIVLRGGGNESLTCTPNHPFLARPVIPKMTDRNSHKSGLGEATWVRADYLAWKNPSSQYTLQHSGFTWATPTSVPSLPIPDVTLQTKNRMKSDLDVKMDKNIAWLIGYWLGDGWSLRSKGGKMRLVANLRDADLLWENINKINGLAWRIGERRKSVVIYETTSAGFVAWMETHFGRYAHFKRLPGWVYGMKKELREALLDGYLQADGCRYAPQKRVFAASVSKQLAHGMALLASTLGHNTTIRYVPAGSARYINDQPIRPGPCYRITWTQEKAESEHFFDDGWLRWKRVKTATYRNSPQTVYDLEIEDDHSFVADGIIVHNCNWGALDEDPFSKRWMRPLKGHEGEYYDAFLASIRQRGYSLAETVVNCADYGDATSRKRLFVLGRKGAHNVTFPPPTHTGDPIRHPGLLPHRSAREIIDWSLRGEPITHRPRGPHAVPTLRRIRSGYDRQPVVLRPILLELIDRLIPIADRFHATLARRPSAAALKKQGRKLTAAQRAENKRVLDHARKVARRAIRKAYATSLGALRSADLKPEEIEAFAFVLGQQSGSAPRDPDEPLMTVSAGGAIGLSQAAAPLLVKANASDRPAGRDEVQSLEKPVRTVVAKDCRALAEPVAASSHHGSGDERSRGINEPVRTVAGRGGEGLARPVIAQLYGGNVAGGATDEVDEPLATVTAQANHHALIETTLAGEPFVPAIHGLKDGDGRTKPVSDPLGTVGAAGNQHALARTIVVSRNGARPNGTRARDIDRPLYAATGSGAGDLARPVVANLTHANRCTGIDEPLQTVRAGGKHQGLAAPVVSGQPILVNQKGQSLSRPIDEPANALTATVKHLAVAEPMLVPQHSAAPARGVERPAPTATGIARNGLADAAVVPNRFGNAAASPDEPLAAATTASGGGLGLTQPLFPDGFLVPNFGEARGQTPRVHPLGKPAPAVTSHGAGALVDVELPEDGPFFELDGLRIAVNVLYRMLRASELAKAHSLGHVEFAGSEADAIKQVGNSIPAETAAAGIGAVLLPVLASIEGLAEAVA